MKKIKYSQDVDILLIELSDAPIDHAEEQGQIIVHLAKTGEPVMLEIMDGKKFALDVLRSVLQESEIATT